MLEVFLGRRKRIPSHAINGRMQSKSVWNGTTKTKKAIGNFTVRVFLLLCEKELGSFL